MKKRQKLILILAGITLMHLHFSPPATADDDDGDQEIQEQQFLFRMEEAYVQEKGEWQISFTSQYLDGKKSREIEYEAGEKEETLSITDEWQWVTAIEYGLTDWLEIEVEIPVLSVDKTSTKDEEDESTTTDLDETGIGDIELGFGLKLMEEDDDSWFPTTKLGIEVSFPTGNWKKDHGADRYGFEAGLAFSKVIDDFVFHGNIGGGYKDFAREQGESSRVDEYETEGGLALVYRPNDRLDLISEASFEYEVENVADGFNYETQIYFTPGIRYEVVDDFEVGIGAPIGLTYESANWGVLAKMQYEWGD